MQFNKWSKVVCPSEADNHFWVAPTPTQNTVYIVPTIFYFRHLSCVLFYKNKGETKETFFPVFLVKRINQKSNLRIFWVCNFTFVIHQIASNFCFIVMFRLFLNFLITSAKYKIATIFQTTYLYIKKM